MRGRHEPAGHRARRHHRLGFRPDEQARQMSISAALFLVRVAGAQDQPHRHARRAELRRRRSGRAARVRVRRLRRQRRHGRRGLHQPPVGAGRRARHRADALRQHARPRARDFFRALEQLKKAFGSHVVATEIPIGASTRSRRDRPRRHEGLPPDSAERGGFTEMAIPDAQAELARNTARSSWTRSAKSPTP